MQRDNDQNISFPLKPVILWLIAAVGGSMGGAAMMPGQSDVFASREWQRNEERIRQLELRTAGLPLLEYRVEQLKVVCDGK